MFHVSEQLKGKVALVVFRRWVRIVVPHGQVYPSLAQLAQQAHTRDMQDDDLSIVRLSNIFGELTKAHGYILD
jgi:hypothetical protein